ncbi:2OG-Fe(II) oxygenase [Shewanella surugensis]|uniref:2OG-Fe(II) oxygenase n=1 Tax=Shewanella surugensis TaxID=212020 RepID=A0ABT0L5K8_9GAMM|nr:2OG-Fe(II) oxygenase [Shewanella surugensis]MCL1122966.1 2OG-Fe(II) oxygenase [Shewanella surugensis]
MTAVNTTKPEQAFVVKYEPGAENPSLPTWGNSDNDPIQLSEQDNKPVKLVENIGVPGGFQLLNVLSKAECQRLIDYTEALGYLPDAAVSLPREVRHNHNVTWVVDEATDQLIWDRVSTLVEHAATHYQGKKPLGLNGRFRFYRYKEGDFFKTHIDGSWPGSRVIDDELVANAYPDRWSQMTFLILLNDDFEGGATQFWIDKNDPSKPTRVLEQANIVDIHTPAGGVLCFPHGMHPLHCLHSSDKVTRGSKYIIRTDMLFEI